MRLSLQALLDAGAVLAFAIVALGLTIFVVTRDSVYLFDIRAAGH